MVDCRARSVQNKMMRLSGKKIQILRDSRGQVAIFVALVFQILFLFFAMVINVGLLVHQKINLQNSVDLAAYYGAMKQAENLNAMAHINYQIRQSWKLLVFRYRGLGTAGEYRIGQTHPFLKEPRPGSLQNATDTVLQPENIYTAQPPFCITYLPFQPLPDNENTCRNLATGTQKISLVKPPPVIAGFLNLSGLTRAVTQDLMSRATRGCKIMGSFNYVTLAKFVATYNEDQRAKMEALKGIAKSMSDSAETFKDIDGDDVRAGMIKTLKNNLTAPNAEAGSFDESNIKTFNSLAEGSCAGPGLGDWPKWVAPIKIFPGFTYVDTVCDNSAIQTNAKELSQSSPPTHFQETPLRNDVVELGKVLGIDPTNIFSQYNLSIGVEKNPWCMAYVAVKATVSPKIPFSPFGRIKITAQAIAKPFGGRIGPWYGKTWSPGFPNSNFVNSNIDTKMDPLLPPRLMDQSALALPNDPSRISNYSRYVGDPYGYKSRLPLGYFGQAIFKMNEAWNPGYAGKAPNYNDWAHLPDYNKNGLDDMLAWDSDANQPPTMRYLELSAVLPDLFDMAYYSIEPNFFGVYFERLKNGLAKQLGIGDFIRPDIGYRGGVQALSRFSVKDQYQVLDESVGLQKLGLNVKDDFKYKSTDWKNLLTGWASFGLGDYKIDEKRFAACENPVEEGDYAASGNCKSQGGTTGYGVKLVSPRFLKRSDLELGGVGGPTGAIENPLPSSF